MWFVIIIGVMLLAILSPAILGALLRLACPKTHIDTLSFSIGTCFAILIAFFAGEEAGVLQLANIITDKQDIPAGALNAIIILMVVLKIGIYAAIASLGIKLTDKLRGSQQKDGQVSPEGAPSGELSS